MEKGKCLLSIAACIIILVVSVPVKAEQFSWCGRPFNIYGYLTQEVDVNMKNQKSNYDAVRGIQSALTTLMVETNYQPTDTVKLAASGRLTVDWAYQINSGKDEWNDKQFSKSKSHFNVDDHYWQILNEAYVQWTPGPFNFKIGKQIVQWGEATGATLLNQINPIDARRSFGNIDPENTMIPTWLIKAEYYPRFLDKWVQDLGIEFVFNPNAEFIPNQLPSTGNDEYGIWGAGIYGPDVMDLPFLGIVPASVVATAPPLAMFRSGWPVYQSYIGSNYKNDWDAPGRFNHQGFEYALRLKGNIGDTLVTLNGFYGLDKSGVANLEGATFSRTPNGDYIVHVGTSGYYPLLRFVGITASRTFTSLSSSALGGVAPTVFFEGMYAFNSTFSVGSNLASMYQSSYFKSDEYRIAVGATWKMKVDWINPRNYISFMPQWYMQRILNFPRTPAQQVNGSPSLYDGTRENNYMTTFVVSTAYMNSKLTPSIAWIRSWTHKSDMFNVSLAYARSSDLNYTLGAVYMTGEKPEPPFQFTENKSYIYFKIGYKWG